MLGSGHRDLVPACQVRFDDLRDFRQDVAEINTARPPHPGDTSNGPFSTHHRHPTHHRRREPQL